MPSRKQKQAPPVVYDEAAHREFVTGFRKRKQARRQAAAANATATEKETRREERRARREVFRTEKEESDEEVEGKGTAEEFLYAGEGDALVTASVTPLNSRIDQVVISLAENKGGEGNGIEESEIVKRTANGRSALKGGSGQNEKGGLMRTMKGVTVAGVRKARKNGRKRRVSYTHLLSKSNMRKAQLRKRAKRN